MGNIHKVEHVFISSLQSEVEYPCTKTHITKQLIEMKVTTLTNDNNTKSSRSSNVITGPNIRVDNKIKGPAIKLENNTNSHKNLRQNRKIEKTNPKGNENTGKKDSIE